jgi:excisionase family DNA binding protein
MPERLYTTGEVAKIFGVSYVAVKKWAYSGKIKYIKTPGGKYSEIKRLLDEAPKGRVAIYARVRQKQRLLELRARVTNLLLSSVSFINLN